MNNQPIKTASIAYLEGGHQKVLFSLFQGEEISTHFSLLKQLSDSSKENIPLANNILSTDKNGKPYLELMTYVDVPVQGDDLDKLNNHLLHTKYLIEKFDFDLTFDQTAQLLVAKYQRFSINQTLNPNSGFSNIYTKNESENLIKHQNPSTIPNQLVDQYLILRNYQQPNSDPDLFIHSTHDHLNKLYQHPKMPKILFHENKTEYQIIFPANLEQGFDVLFAEQLEEKQINYTLTQTEDNSTISTEKNANALNTLYNQAIANAYTIAASTQTLQQEIKSLGSAVRYPVKDIAQTMIDTVTNNPAVDKALDERSLNR